MYNQLSFELAAEYALKESRAAGKEQWSKANKYAILCDFWHDMSGVL